MKTVQLIAKWFLLVFILSAGTAVAQPQLIEKVEQGSGMTIPFEKWKLTNGLTILVHEDHTNPLVTVRITYHVGSARESIGKSGFAHFFEHMMFEGSDHVKDKEHFKIISEAGGTMNGNTERDKTNYFEIVPSNNLEVALWLEADRMGFLLDSVTKEKFEIQRATVKNEKSQNVENIPYAMAFVETINQILYPPGHPYSWPVIGYVDDLNRVTVDDLKNFFLRWYGPNNAILTISGDVNTKDAIALAGKYFGPINPSPEVKKIKVPTPILSVDQYANYVDNIYLPLTLMVYPTVPRFHRDEAALMLMADMMGEGNNSVFYKNFVKTEKAIAAQVGYTGDELAGELSVTLVAYPNMEDPTAIGKDFNETEKKIHETITEFETSGITDDALQRVKSAKESHIVDEISTTFGKAELLTDWQLFIGRPYNLSDELDRFNKVTKEDITRVFNKYVKDKYAAIVNVYPKSPDSKDSVKSVNPNANLKATDDAEYAGLKYVKAKDSFDRSKRPLAGTPKAPVIPQSYSQVLKNGIKVIGTKTQTPKVVMLMTIRGGNMVFSADPKKSGLSELTSGLMNEGTQNYTTEQISAELDKLGSSIAFDGGRENTTVEIQSLTKNIDATLKLLEEKLFRPRFDAADFKRVKKQYIESLANDRKSADATADKLYSSILFGNTILGAYPTEKNIRKFSLDDVKAYYQQYYSPSVSSFVIVGDISEAEILPKLAFLEKWESKEVKLPEITVTPSVLPTTIYIANKDNAPQSVFKIGNTGLPFDATGDYFKANVMNFALGGAFNSRLNLNLREEKGFTYGIRSGFQGTKYPGTYTIGASVRRTATDSSITEVMREIKEYKEKGLTDEEVAFTRNSILNSEALRYESPFQKAMFLSRIVQYDLPTDFTIKQAQILKDMTKEDMNALAKKYLNPDTMVILVVGNKYTLKDKLEKLGYGKIKDVDLE
ncbi:MAG: insulinase family protein [Bacteroidetes bacterium]|nr:insulinase family protein [Bacteroidota bacterium]